VQNNPVFEDSAAASLELFEHSLTAWPPDLFQLKVTVTVRSLVRFTVHACPDVESQPDQPPNVDPLGVAVNVTVPLVKCALHVVAQLRPEGELVTVPEPAPAKFTVRVGPEPKQTTFAVMLPVTIAPDESRFPELLFVVTVAETRALPQATPVTTNKPAGVTVTMSSVFEFQMTWSVISLVTGGCIKVPSALS
jgi:hypothetical protein